MKGPAILSLLSWALKQMQIDSKILSRSPFGLIKHLNGKDSFRMIQSLLSLFQNVPHELVVMLLAAMPIVELGAAIPVGIAVFHLSPIVVYLFAIVGNLLPLLLVFFFLPKVLRLFAKHSPRLHALFDRYFFALTTKHVSSFDRYGAIFLFILVAVPNP